MLPGSVGMRLGGPRHDWSQTWQGIKRITRRASTGMSARKGRLKKVYPPMSKNGNLISTDEEKAEVHFCLCLHWQPLSSPLLFDEMQDGDQRGKALPTVKEDQVQDHLRKVNVQKSMGSDEIHPRVLRELADGIVRTLHDM